MHKDFTMMPGPRAARLLNDPNLLLSSLRNSLFFLLLYFQALATIHSTQLTCPCSPEKTSKKEQMAELRDGSQTHSPEAPMSP